MARIKNINTRIQLKNDTENNWNKAKAEEGKDGFIPLLGEAIVYMGENGHGPRIKIGDGETNVTELPFLEDNDTVYTASNGIEITAGNIIQHINNLGTPPSEIGFYKIKYDQQGHINGATAVSKQDILDLLQMTPGRIDSVQITAEAPLVSSNSTENTTNLVTNISFSSQEKNTVLAGPTQSATGAPSFRLLAQDDIPNLSASKITEGTFSAERIDNLPTSKITSGVFDVNRIPNLEVNKITGIIPVSQGGTGVDGVNGNLENNIPSFFNNGVFVYDAINTRFKQFSITAPGNTDTFTSYVNSLNGATENLLIDLDTLIRAIPPMNLVNPAIKYDENQEIKQSYRPSYYSPTTKGIKNSVLISDGDGDSNEDGLEPIWLDPTILSTEGYYGGALFYGRDNDSEDLIKPFKTQWGTLPVEQGGTGNTSFSIGQVLIGSGKNSITTIEKTDLATSNTIVQRDINGDFATHSITLIKSLLSESFNTNFPNRNIIDIDNNNIATFFGILNANNLKATIGEIEMSCSLSGDDTKQSKITWYNPESTDQLIGELYWDNISKRGTLKNYYLSENLILQSDAYYLPEVNTSSTTNNNFTLLATEETASNMFPANSVLYSDGKVNKITYKNSANGALYSTSANGSLEWGTLPVAQGGTGVTTIANIQAGKDGDGETISSTYLKLSGGTLTGNLNIKNNSPWTLSLINDASSGMQGLKTSGYGISDPINGTAWTEDERWIIYIDENGNVKLPGEAYNVYGTVAVEHGGTDADTAAGARYNLDVPSTTGSGASGTWGISIRGTAANVTGTVAIEHGGTGAINAAAARSSLGITPANIGAVSTSAIIDIAHGGTGATTKEGALTNLFYDNQANDAQYLASLKAGWIGGNIPLPLDPKFGGTGATTAAGARTNLDVPSITGSGASGTWGIDITGSSGSCTGNAATASAITNITTNDAASSSDTWRRVWISYDNNITGRPAYNDNLAYQTSTNTLKSNNLTLNGNLYWAPNSAYYWNGNAAYSGTYYTNNWFRSFNGTGWYNETYGGGIFMEDSTWVKVYNGKSFLVPGSLQVGSTITASNYIYSASYVQAANTMYINSGNLNMMYNNTWYPVIQNHGNGNTSFNAAGGGIHYGYSNTSGHYFYLTSSNKVGQLDSNGLYLTGSNGWIRTYGGCGWYNESYGGGIHMTDANWVRIYGSKGLHVDNSIEISANGHIISIEANTTNCGIKVDGAWLCFRANGGNHFPNS